MYICIYIHICIYIWTYEYIHIFIFIYMYRCIHLYICIYMYTYIHVCLCIYLRPRWWWRCSSTASGRRRSLLRCPRNCFSALLLLSLELSDTTVYEPWIRVFPETASQFCEVKPLWLARAGATKLFPAPEFSALYRRSCLSIWNAVGGVCSGVRRYPHIGLRRYFLAVSERESVGMSCWSFRIHVLGHPNRSSFRITGHPDRSTGLVDRSWSTRIGSDVPTTLCL